MQLKQYSSLFHHFNNIGRRSKVADLESFPVLSLFPQGFSHLLLPHFAAFFGDLHQHCTFILLPTRKGVIGPAVLALVVGEVVASVGAFGVDLPLADP